MDSKVVLLTGVMAFAAAGASHITHAAPPPTDAAAASQRIAELEDQVKALRAKIQLLEAELKASRTAAAAAPTDEPKRDPKGEPPAKTYGSILEILQSLPKDLSPKPAIGWDKFDFPKVTKWLNGTFVGQKFRGTGTIASAKVSPSPGASSNPSLPPWKAYLYLRKRDYKFRGLIVRQTVGTNTYGAFYLSGDESFARQMDKVKAGTIVQVEGIISGVRFGQRSENIRYVSIILTNAGLTGATLPK
ncbi:MAG: bZIP transcription factor [Phycisphaerae bacterium]|nr:bZIP transcription factor [Phycisphaerae bacterium]